MYNQWHPPVRFPEPCTCLMPVGCLVAIGASLGVAMYTHHSTVVNKLPAVKITKVCTKYTMLALPNNILVLPPFLLYSITDTTLHFLPLSCPYSATCPSSRQCSVSCGTTPGRGWHWTPLTPYLAMCHACGRVTQSGTARASCSTRGTWCKMATSYAVCVCLLSILCTCYIPHSYRSFPVCMYTSMCTSPPPCSPFFPTRFNYAPDLHIPPKVYENPEAGGKNRYKYFRRPIIPFLPQMPPNVLLAPTRSVLYYVHVHVYTHRPSSQGWAPECLVLVCMCFTGVVCWVRVSFLSSLPLPQLCSVWFHVWLHPILTVVKECFI